MLRMVSHNAITGFEGRIPLVLRAPWHADFATLFHNTFLAAFCGLRATCWQENVDFTSARLPYADDGHYRLFVKDEAALKELANAPKRWKLTPMMALNAGAALLGARGAWQGKAKNDQWLIMLRPASIIAAHPAGRDPANLFIPAPHLTGHEIMAEAAALDADFPGQFILAPEAVS